MSLARLRLGHEVTTLAHTGGGGVTLGGNGGWVTAHRQQVDQVQVHTARGQVRISPSVSMILATGPVNVLVTSTRRETINLSSITFTP